MSCKTYYRRILDIKNLKMNYGPIAALKGIDISVDKGQIVALLGANGAGKTTTLKVISGLLKPTSGEIIYNSKNVAGKNAFKIAKAGIMQSPEGRHVLVGLTVEENLRVGGYNVKSKQQLLKNFERVYSLFPRLKERAKQQANTLSGGEQQMLAIGRALMGSPQVLLLDEPSLGLAPLLIKDIFQTLKKIKEEGTTILIVEQNALATLKIADYAYVLELGKISMHGKAEDLIKDERLIAAYLGGK
ncbi:MAG: ABC transporter ATP-binding protein [Clostridia bacterium]|nr:ABC transporter ATP-binding protein [Clostridia bacterium]